MVGAGIYSVWINSEYDLVCLKVHSRFTAGVAFMFFPYLPIYNP